MMPLLAYYTLPNGRTLQINAGAVRPFQCLATGGRLAAARYGFYFLASLVIVLLTLFVPLTGLTWGAWNVGIFLALLGQMRGEMASASTIMKGFKAFRTAVAVSVLSGLPLLPAGVGFQITRWWIEQTEKSYPNSTMPPEVAKQMLIMLGAIVALYLVGHLISNIIFAFAYPLVGEQRLSAWQATKASAHAVRRNIGGVTLLATFDLILSAVGFVLCFVGLSLTLPITKAAWAVAYKQVFPEEAPAETHEVPVYSQAAGPHAPYSPTTVYNAQPLPLSGSAGSGGSAFVVVGLIAGFILVLALLAGGGVFVYLRTRSQMKVNAQPPLKKVKTGFIDQTGKMVVAPTFDDASVFSEDLAPVKIGSKWGFIDKSGTLVIAAQFDGAALFEQGLAPVKNGSQWGYIDKRGQFSIQPTFDEAYSFSNDLAAVKTGGVCGFIDKKGKFVIHPVFQDVLFFLSDLAAVKQDGKWGYINPAGKFVIDREFDDARSFRNGWAGVKKDGKWFFINKGRVEMRLGVSESGQFLDALTFSENLAAVKYTDNTWGYIDTSGQFKIQPQFEEAYSFHEGLAAAKRGNKWGFIDRAGAFVISPRFVWRSVFSEGLAPVAIEDKQ